MKFVLKQKSFLSKECDMEYVGKSLDYKINACLAIALNPNSSDWAKKFWRQTAEKLMQKKVDK